MELAIRNIKWWHTVVILSAMFLSQLSVYAMTGQGGYLSEKVIDLTGITNSLVTIGSSGISNSIVDVGTAPSVSVLSPEISGSSVTLRGSVADMKGFPSASVYFRWGRSANLENTTATQEIASTGTYTVSITTEPEGEVYYRFYAEADGISYATSSFEGEPTNPIYWLARVFPYVFLGIVLSLLVMGVATGNIGAVIISAVLAVIGIVGTAIIQTVVRTLW